MKVPWCFSRISMSADLNRILLISPGSRPLWNICSPAILQDFLTEDTRIITRLKTGSGFCSERWISIRISRSTAFPVVCCAALPLPMPCHHSPICFCLMNRPIILISMQSCGFRTLSAPTAAVLFLSVMTVNSSTGWPPE